MNNNPYSQPKTPLPPEGDALSMRLLWWGSAILVGSGMLLCIVMWGTAVSDAINGWGKPVANSIAALIITIVFCLICVPQYISVFRKSANAAKLVIRLSFVGIAVALIAAVAYPIFEYRMDFSPPGFEILGAVSYTAVAMVFGTNLWLHRRWLQNITQTPNDT